jgi:hypothetical protein
MGVEVEMEASAPVFATRTRPPRLPRCPVSSLLVVRLSLLDTVSGDKKSKYACFCEFVLRWVGEVCFVSVISGGVVYILFARMCKVVRVSNFSCVGGR